MTDLRTAATQALEALKKSHPYSNSDSDLDKHSESITALRAALAITKQTNQCGETCERASLCATCARGLEDVQPVAWRVFDGEGGYDYVTYDDNENYAEEFVSRNPRYASWVEALYTK